MDDEYSGEEEVLQVPSQQSLQSVLFTVMVMHDQLVQNGCLEPGQVTERMKAYSFDDPKLTDAVQDVITMLDRNLSPADRPAFGVIDGGKPD